MEEMKTLSYLFDATIGRLKADRASRGRLPLRGKPNPQHRHESDCVVLCLMSRGNPINFCRLIRRHFDQVSRSKGCPVTRMVTWQGLCESADCIGLFITSHCRLLAKEGLCPRPKHYPA